MTGMMAWIVQDISPNICVLTENTHKQDWHWLQELHPTLFQDQETTFRGFLGRRRMNEFSLLTVHKQSFGPLHLARTTVKNLVME